MCVRLRGGGGTDKVDQRLMLHGNVCETEKQKWMNQPVLKLRIEGFLRSGFAHPYTLRGTLHMSPVAGRAVPVSGTNSVLCSYRKFQLGYRGSL